jgi:hypothetical protein
MGEAFNTYWKEDRRIQGFGVKPERKSTLGISRRRWEGNIEMDLQEVGWGHGIY